MACDLKKWREGIGLRGFPFMHKNDTACILTEYFHAGVSTLLRISNPYKLTKLNNNRSCYLRFFKLLPYRAQLNIYVIYIATWIFTPETQETVRMAETSPIILRAYYCSAQTTVNTESNYRVDSLYSTVLDSIGRMNNYPESHWVIVCVRAYHYHLRFFQA